MGGCDRGKVSSELEGLAELELGPLERAPAGEGGIAEGALVSGDIEMDAVLASEPELESVRLETQAFIDARPHGRRRSSATTASTWLVWGNISNAATETGA